MRFSDSSLIGIVKLIYINYHLQYEVTMAINNRHGGAPSINTTVSYGKLEKELACELPDDDIFGYLRQITCLLTLVTSVVAANSCISFKEFA
jgi:hypothetical protein